MLEFYLGHQVFWSTSNFITLKLATFYSFSYTNPAMIDTEIKNQVMQEGPIEELSTEIKDMMEAGVFFGCSKSHTHPRMKQFTVGNRNGVDIINLHKTLEMLNDAVIFVKTKVAEGGSVLVVSTQPALADLAREFAKKADALYVVKRWLGGTLTNFKIISKRIEYYKKLKADFASGAMEKYTKKERLSFEREMRRLEEFLGGLEHMQRLPSVLIIVDPKVHSTAIREAKQTNVPVVTLTNIDVNPEGLAHPVVGNNKGRSSVKWFLDGILKGIEEGRQAALSRAAAASENKSVVGSQ
jgi:small subunit ribosomal protein S2